MTVLEQLQAEPKNLWKRIVLFIVHKAGALCIQYRYAGFCFNFFTDCANVIPDNPGNTSTRNHYIGRRVFFNYVPQALFQLVFAAEYCFFVA